MAPKDELSYSFLKPWLGECGGGWSDNSTPECPPNGAGCHRGGDSTSGCPQEGSGCVTGDRGSRGQGQLPWVTLVGTGVTGEEMADFGGRTLVDPGVSHGTGAAGDRDNPPGCLWQTPVSPPRGGAAAEPRAALGAAPATPDARLPRGCAPELPENLQPEHPRAARERCKMSTSPHSHPKS